MQRLLAAFGDDRLHVFTDRALRSAVERGEGRLLPGRYHYFLHKDLRGNRWRAGRAINAAVNVALALLAGVRAARLARRVDAAWIVSVADEGFSPLAAAVGAALSGRPHVLMVFDLWEENAYTEFEQKVARRFERRILAGASCVVVHNEQMAMHYANKHGITCDVLPTSVELGPAPAFSLPARDRPEVLFAGAVYWAQEDAVRRLSRVVSRHALDFTILGPWADRGALAARGIEPTRLEADLPALRFQARLAAADVLFLGLSFDSAYPDVVRTAAPAKLPEYMASGRPILIHAPRGSHVAEYARGEDFAEVVDTPDDGALERGLLSTLDDPERGRARSVRARRLAVERHELGKVRESFERILEKASRRA